MNKMIKRAIIHGLILAIIVILSFCMLTSCQTKNQSKNDIPQDEEFQVSGHILYGYKHGLKVYGQYMDQAGEDNAMILLFVERESGSSADVNCRNISVNGTQVDSSITVETISPKLSALQINLNSSTINVDELSGDDAIAIVLEIIDSQSNKTIETTNPIIFSGS